jgi:hypothetical protein
LWLAQLQHFMDGLLEQSKPAAETKAGATTR